MRDDIVCSLCECDHVYSNHSQNILCTEKDAYHEYISFQSQNVLVQLQPAQVQAQAQVQVQVQAQVQAQVLNLYKVCTYTFYLYVDTVTCMQNICIEMRYHVDIQLNLYMVCKFFSLCHVYSMQNHRISNNLCECHVHNEHALHILCIVTSFYHVGIDLNHHILCIHNVAYHEHTHFYRIYILLALYHDNI